MVAGQDLFSMFGAALGLVAPWQVTLVEFDKDAGELQIGLDFPRGSRFACPIQGCGQSARVVHDALDKRWRHLDFFEHRAFLAAWVPGLSVGSTVSTWSRCRGLVRVAVSRC